MEYRAGTVGRVIAVRFDHGEDLLAGLRDIMLKEKVASGWFQIIGALGKAGVVTGPKEPVVPPDPIWQEVNSVCEVVGSGSVHLDNGEPKIHLHAALGDHGETLTACVRRDSRVYLTIELLLFELLGLGASKSWDEKSQYSRLFFAEP
ncbi:DNA-binding protein [Desulfobulbus sp. F4]|nr:DNA-binding protein [Desulfobulbus sp. F4]